MASMKGSRSVSYTHLIVFIVFRNSFARTGIQAKFQEGFVSVLFIVLSLIHISLAYMADDVEWLGPFSCQTASDKKTMEDILRPEYSIRLALADERWRARKPVSYTHLPSEHPLRRRPAHRQCL